MTDVHRIAVVLLFVLAVIVASWPAMPAPPAGADPALGDYFRGLKIPGTAQSCCDKSDCRFVPSRRNAAGWEALIDPANFLDAGQLTGPIDPGKTGWIRVPPDRVIGDRESPRVMATACWTPWHGLICFVPPATAI